MESKNIANAMLKPLLLVLALFCNAHAGTSEEDGSSYDSEKKTIPVDFSKKYVLPQSYISFQSSKKKSKPLKKKSSSRSFDDDIIIISSEEESIEPVHHFNDPPLENFCYQSQESSSSSIDYFSLLSSSSSSVSDSSSSIKEVESSSSVEDVQEKKRKKNHKNRSKRPEKKQKMIKNEVLQYIGWFDPSKQPNMKVFKTLKFDLDEKGWNKTVPDFIRKSIETEIELRYQKSPKMANFAKLKHPDTKDLVYDVNEDLMIRDVDWNPPGKGSMKGYSAKVSQFRENLRRFLPNVEEYLLWSVIKYAKSRNSKLKIKEWRSNKAPSSEVDGKVKVLESCLRTFIDYVLNIWGEEHCNWSAFLSKTITLDFISRYSESSESTLSNQAQLLAKVVLFLLKSSDYIRENYGNTCWSCYLSINLERSTKVVSRSVRQSKKMTHEEAIEKGKSFNEEQLEIILVETLRQLEELKTTILQNIQRKINRTKIISKMILLKQFLKFLCHFTFSGGIGPRRQLIAGMTTKNFYFNTISQQMNFRPDWCEKSPRVDAASVLLLSKTISVYFKFWIDVCRSFILQDLVNDEEFIAFWISRNKSIDSACSIATALKSAQSHLSHVISLSMSSVDFRKTTSTLLDKKFQSLPSEEREERLKAVQQLQGHSSEIYYAHYVYEHSNSSVSKIQNELIETQEIILSQTQENRDQQQSNVYHDSQDDEQEMIIEEEEYMYCKHERCLGKKRKVSRQHAYTYHNHEMKCDKCGSMFETIYGRRRHKCS